MQAAPGRDTRCCCPSNKSAIAYFARPVVPMNKRIQRWRSSPSPLLAAGDTSSASPAMHRSGGAAPVDPPNRPPACGSPEHCAGLRRAFHPLGGEPEGALMAAGAARRRVGHVAMPWPQWDCTPQSQRRAVIGN